MTEAADYADAVAKSRRGFGNRLRGLLRGGAITDETWEEVDAAERAELRARVEAALEQLRQVEHELEEIAIALGRPSADAARVAVRRSLLKIAAIMKQTK
jgi:Asp-tRNA(Asn)/Glu-tRNA(Gln) amidotransferase A subunit family amidase